MSLVLASPPPVVTSPISSRWRELDIARGMAMFFVVVGHLIEHGPPGQGWYDPLKSSIYQFHMPLFFFVSGLATAFSVAKIAGPVDYVVFFWRRMRVLAPDYLTYGILAVAAKLALSTAAHEAPSALAGFARQGLTQLLVTPASGPARQLWFLYVLLGFYLLLVPPLRLRQQAWMVILPLSCVTCFLPAPTCFCLRHFLVHAPFFIAGLSIARHRSEFMRIMRQYGWLAVPSMAFALWTWPAPGTSLPDDPASMAVKFACAWMSVAITWLVATRFVHCLSALEAVGRYSLAVFLIHQLPLSVIRITAEKLGLFHGIGFPLLAVCMVGLGLWVPVQLKVRVLSKLRWLDTLTG